MNAAAPHIPPTQFMHPSWDELINPPTLPEVGVPGVPSVPQPVPEAGDERLPTAAHRRKERYLERRNALQFAIEVKLIALGYGILTAALTAALALKENWQRARDEMERAGYSYFDMVWIKGKT